MVFYYQIPFGASGDRTGVPVSAQPDGSTSYTEGYGPEYSAPRDTDPSALTISREQFNEIIYAITANLQQYQQHGVPEFITSADNGGSAYGYSKYAMVRWDNGTEVANYISLIASNTSLPSDNTKWAQIRTDVAYLGVANIFTAQQTINCNGSPLVLQSANSTGAKLIMKDTTNVRGAIGATSAYVLASYLSDATTIAGGWDSSGNLVPGAAATYDLGASSAQFRAVFANRYEVLGSTVATNGIYLGAANNIYFSTSGVGRMRLSTAALAPVTNDGITLGSASLNWSDLFLASGGVINWNNGNVTITHSAGALAFAGASSGYTFAGGAVLPAVDNGAALGTATVGWSDLFLASGGVINWNNGNATLVHSAGLLTSTVPIAAHSFTATSNAVATNGLYLQSANIVGISANSVLSSRFRSVASAVNYIDHISAAAGNNPSVLAAGNDASVTLTIGGQGSGGVLILNTLSTPNVVVTGASVPANGLYLPAANTPAVAVNSSIGVAFGAGTIGPNTTQRHILPAVANDTIALLAATQTLTGKKINLVASATGGASLNISQGVAPTSPSNGDIWTTSASVFAQINGATIDLAGGSGGITVGTPVTLSGTSSTITGIPSSANRIIINFDSVQTNSTSPLWLRLGDSGGLESSGYTGQCAYIAGTSAQVANSTDFRIGIDTSNWVSGNPVTGTLVLERMTGNKWILRGNFGSDSASFGMYIPSGEKTTSAALDRVQLGTPGGTATLSGSWSVNYE